MAGERDYSRGLELKYLQQLGTDEGRQAFVEEYVDAIVSDPDPTLNSKPVSKATDGNQNDRILKRKLKGALARWEGAEAKRRLLAQDNKALRRRLQQAEADNKRLEGINTELRTTLTGLRHSKTMRLGRTILAPLNGYRSLRRKAGQSSAVTQEKHVSAQETAAASLVRRAVDNPTSSPARQPSGSQEGVGSRVPRPDELDSRTPQLAQVASQKKVVELDEKIAQIEGGSCDESVLVSAINELWYRRGDITRPLGLVAVWEANDLALPDSVKRLVPDMESAKRWLDEEIGVPPRVYSPIFRPVRDKILYCVNNAPTYSSNGYATRTRGVAAGLADNGFEVHVVSRPGFPWNAGTSKPEKRFQEELDGVAYAHYPPSGNRTSIQDNMDAATDAFLREARRSRPEFIQAASDHLTAFPALVAARLCGVPFVYEVRGLWEYSRCAKIPEWEGSERFQLAVKLETILVQEADHVLAITPQVADVLRERGASDDQLSLLPNAIEPDRFMPIPPDHVYAKKIGLDLQAVHIGFAGSMVGYEGLDDLITAFHQMRVNHPEIDAQLVLAGSGECENDLKKLVSQLGIGNQVVFPGRIPQSDMPRLLSLFDVMACPRKSTTVTNLVSPLKPLEGFSTYCAVVLSDVAPNVDLAGPGSKRARLVKSGDANELAEALTELCTDADARRDLCRQGRMWVLTERSWKAICQATVSTYRSLRGAQHFNTVDLASLRVGIIADEFTTAAFSGECELVPLSRSRWKSQIDGLDLVLIESAWEGNQGEWHRGIGRYEDHEFKDIRRLLFECQERNIPTAFWNKEDPIHTKRFLPTAIRCDAIFTTDADLVSYYRERAGAGATILSLPFFAQPKTHNPIRTPGQTDVDSFAYAGTYYGDRYPDRTKELLPLLLTANSIRLTVFDRQADNPESPYKFPTELQGSVVGSLPYGEVLETYKTYTAHLNGNSVTNSPTMLSRRVVEIAASGGVVISTPGRAMWELFGSAFPVYHSPLELEGLLNLWFWDPEARRAEAWEQMRSVLRRHTAADALCLIARALGIPVAAESRPGWVAVVENLGLEMAQSLLSQTVQPDSVYWTSASDEASELLGDAAGGLISEAQITAGTWVALLSDIVPPSRYEDLLFAAQFGDFDRAFPTLGDQETGRALASVVADIAVSDGAIIRSQREISSMEDLERELVDNPGTCLAIAVEHTDVSTDEVADVRVVSVIEPPKRLLIAGHDLKFIEPYYPDLEQHGFSISVDKWDDHTHHDESRSIALLEEADIVLAEWCLGNAVWYSKHVRPDQRLVTRVHLQEIDLPYLDATKKGRVDEYIFVNPLYLETAVLRYGLSRQKSIVVPNIVDCAGLDLPKVPDSSLRVGVVGITPERKRLDIALDVFEEILLGNPDHKLVVKGRLPEDYPWMKDRPDEMEYYVAQYDRIESINVRHPGAITFEGYGDDMGSWYRSVGAVLSTSDFESFHYTIADGAASGAIPGLLYWPGAEYSYPLAWISAEPNGVARSVTSPEGTAAEFAGEIASRYSRGVVVPRLVDVLRGYLVARGGGFQG